MRTTSTTILSERFEQAVVLACRLHATQRKKGTGVPYVAHLLGVTSLVLEDGGDEDHAIAAVLHDAIEDQNLAEQQIEERFGARVRAIVVGCTDAFEQPKPPWRARKETYLAHLREAPEDVLRVSAADKLHNAR
jgi:(p)ppGpp synthase/HD superfamily hydrolase